MCCSPWGRKGSDMTEQLNSISVKGGGFSKPTVSQDSLLRELISNFVECPQFGLLLSFIMINSHLCIWGRNKSPEMMLCSFLCIVSGGI